MGEPAPQPDSDRSILDICFDFAEAAEDDAGDDAGSGTRDALLALLKELAQQLRATTEEEDREMFVGEDGIELVIAALGRHSADGGVIKAAWSVLQHTCKNQPPHRRMVAGGGGLELLVKALVDFAADASVFRVLLGAANQLCTKDERNKVMINGLGGTASILAALESFGSDEAMVAALLETLTWLMRDDDESVEQSFRSDMIGALWEQNLLDVLIDIVEADETAELVLNNALRVLMLFCDSDKGAEDAVDNGLVDLSLGLLRTRLDQHSVLCASTRLLKDLCMHNESAKESLLSEEADELLLGLLKSHTAHAAVLESAMSLLLGIMFRDESTSEKLVEKGLIATVITGLSTHPTDKLLFRSSCMMLRELCRVEDNQRIMKEEGVEKLMVAGMKLFAEAGGAGAGERAYKGKIPFQEYGRDVLRDCHSDHCV